MKKNGDIEKQTQREQRETETDRQTKLEGDIETVRETGK